MWTPRALLALGLAALAAAGPALAGGAPAPGEDERILHVLSRLTYGPRPGDLERVRAMGLPIWLAGQLDPERLDDTRVERALGPLRTLALSTAALHAEYPRPDRELRQQMAAGQLTRPEMLERYPPERRPGRIVAELAAARMVRAVTSERQLLEVMVDFWFNHFNVFAGKGQTLWLLTAYERDVIRPHALGTFPDLLRATARHPAMLFYLDNWLSAREGFTIPVGRQRGRAMGLNENYARELMELHTLGVDGGYTQQDVREVARAFTGWTLDRRDEDVRFVFRPIMHDRGEKVILGHRIPAGGGIEDGERVLDLLAGHPATARFLAAKLVRRFVSDDPPPALVERVAAAYRATGGDIPALLRTIVAAPEFVAAPGEKVKKPTEFVASAVRALGGRVDPRGGFHLARAAGEIGEPLYRAEPPTGHPDRAEAWVSTGALLARMNFALALSAGRVPGVEVDVRRLAPARGGDEVTLDGLAAALLGRPLTPETRAALAAQAPGMGIEKLAAPVLGSPEFQRR